MWRNDGSRCGNGRMRKFDRDCYSADLLKSPEELIEVMKVEVPALQDPFNPRGTRWPAKSWDERLYPIHPFFSRRLMGTFD